MHTVPGFCKLNLFLQEQDWPGFTVSSFDSESKTKNQEPKTRNPKQPANPSTARVHIIGAGPAGSVAAISSLGEGHNVYLYEEHERAGTPINCSGLISTEGLESLTDLVDYKKHTINKMRGAIIDCAGYTLKIDSGKEIAHVIDRSSFDHALAQKAEAEGATLQYGRRVTKFPEGTIIGADGPNSSTANYFNFPKLKRFAGTSQALIRYESITTDYVRVFLSNFLFPGFFAWLIPQNEEYAEIGAGCLLPGNPNTALTNLAKILKTELPIQRAHAIIPVSQRKRTSLFTGSRNVLLVGDAAGQVKSTTGGGVVFGTKCARLAGKYANTPNQYESTWRAKYGSDLDAHYHFHRAFGRLNDSSIRALASIASSLKIEEFLKREGSMDSPTSMIGPNLLMHPIRSLVQK